jgi:hypothetical protein
MNLARVFFHYLAASHHWSTAPSLRPDALPETTALLAIDTFLPFSIISFVLCYGWIKDSGTAESYLWYAATTLNLISISLVNIWLELERRS